MILKQSIFTIHFCFFKQAIRDTQDLIFSFQEVWYVAKFYFLSSKEKDPQAPDSTSISTWINKNKLLSNGYVNQQQALHSPYFSSKSWGYKALDISLIEIKGSKCLLWGDVWLFREGSFHIGREGNDHI